MDDLLAAERDRKISMSPSTFSYLAKIVGCIMSGKTYRSQAFHTYGGRKS